MLREEEEFDLDTQNDKNNKNPELPVAQNSDYMHVVGTKPPTDGVTTVASVSPERVSVMYPVSEVLEEGSQEAIDPENPLGLSKEELLGVTENEFIGEDEEGNSLEIPLDPVTGQPLYKLNENGTPVSSGQRGKKAYVSKALRQARKDYAAGHRVRGMSLAGILQAVNSKGVETGWGVISYSQLKKDLSEYYDSTEGYSLREIQKISMGEKMGLLAMMEEDVATISLMIQEARFNKVVKHNNKERRNLTPGQILMAFGQKLEYQKVIAKLNGWEPSNSTINNQINVQNNAIDATFVERASDGIKSLGGEAAQRYTRITGNIIKALQERRRLAISSGMVTEAGRLEDAESVS